MTRKQLFGVVALGVLFFAPKVAAQYYYPMAVSGYTQDVIANGVGTATSSTTTDVDGVNFAFVSKDFQLTSSSPASSFGLPVTGQFMSITTSTPGLTYQFAPYSTNNSLKLSATNDTGTLTFTTATAAYNLYFITTGGSGAAVANAVVNFTDGTSQSFANLSVADWYTGTNIAIQGIGRVDLSNNNLEDGGGVNPRIYQIPLAISAANQSKLVQSVAFTKVSGNGIINVFGISADKYTTCLAPTAVTASTVTISDGSLNWTAPSAVPSSYDIYYTSSTVAPSPTTTPSQSGITGTTATMTGLSAQTVYHVWIRSNCSGNIGEWAYGTNFKTPCSTFTVPYSENFDTTPVGSTTNTNAPDCWSYLETSGFAGYGYVSTTYPVSAPRSYYLYNAAATTGDQMLVSPQTIALADGTKRVRFSARSSSNGYALQIGTLTNPSDPSTFTAINTISLTTTHTEYIVYIPAGTDSYLAFKNNYAGTYRGIYLDNIAVENNPACIEPSNLTTSNAQTNSVDLSWTAPVVGTPPANGYEYYYSTSSTAPTATTPASGTSTTTSTTVNGLSPSTTYYVWVRSNCSSSDKSIWIGGGIFLTQCGTVSAPYSENFDTTATGSTTNNNAPHCWSYLETSGFAGYGYVSSTYPVSTPRSYYFYNSSATSGDQMLVSPETTALSDGTKGVKFSGRAGANGYQIQVGVLTNPTDASSFTAISTISLTTTHTEYTVLIPAGTGNHLAFRHNLGGTNRGLYIDNIVVNLASQLATSEVSSASKEVKVAPNPFTDIINISDFKDIKSIRVSDVSGRTLKTIQNPEAQINLGDLNAGLYLLNLQFKDGSQKSVKVIKK